MKIEQCSGRKLPDKMTLLEYGFILGVVVVSVVFFLPELGDKLMDFALAAQNTTS